MAQQIKKKFIGNDQVGENQILIESGGSLRAMDGATEVDLISISADEVFLKGVKVLNSSNLVPSAILPSYVDDVLEFADFASLPATGESGKIYVVLDTNKQYRWSGSTYIQITSGAVDSVNGETGVVVLTAGDIQMDSEAVSVQSKITDLEADVGNINLALDDKANTDLSNLVTATTAITIDTDVELTLSGGKVNINSDFPNPEVWINGKVFASSDLSFTKVQDPITVLGFDIFDHIGQGTPSKTSDMLISSGSVTDASISDPVESGSLNISTGNVNYGTGASGDINLTTGQSDNGRGSIILDAPVISVNGELTLNTNRITGIADGVDPADAVNKGQLDLLSSTLQDQIDDHESRLDALEGALAPVWARVKFDLTATDISNGYVDLPHEAIADSIHAFVDRLAIHQGEDFTVSLVSGVTRITFAGDLVAPGQSQLDANDNIYVRYQRLA